ncbi:MAG: hypothetical protein HFF01_09660 [Erysipelotrichaceae bacterium]|nr:hypothetical protein [Erysipelotrichaceae bacterium]
MSVILKTGNYLYPIGSGDYLDSFFSTVAFYVENKKWGSKYPTIMKQLYYGELSYKDVDKAIHELQCIRDDLKKLNKKDHEIIWDARDLSLKVPEWAINHNEEVVTLANYFITNDGRDLIEVILSALNGSKYLGENLFITNCGIEFKKSKFM